MKTYFSFFTLLFTLFIGLLIYSCEKDTDVNPNEQLSISEEVSLSPKDDETLRFDLQEIKNVGILHNKILIEAINRFEPTTKNDYTTFREVFLETVATHEPNFSSQSEVWDICSQFETLTTDELHAGLESSVAKNYAFAIQAAIQSNSNALDIASQLDNISTAAIQNITNKKDLISIVLYAEVSKNSAMLWYGLDNGGLGYGDILDENLGRDIDLKCRKCWNEAAEADGVSAATSFLLLGAWGAVGASIPGSNLFLLGGIGSSAAAASAWAWFRCACE